MKNKRPSLTYRFIKRMLKTFYPKTTIEGAENLPEEPCVIVGNHCQLNGPIICELYFPIKRYTWCAGPMLSRKEAPGYIFEDFWSFKPKRTHWYYKIAARVVAPLLVCINVNAETIGVHRDTRIISTFRNTIEKLQEGDSVVIFPEYDRKYNNIIYDFQKNFVDVARMYYKKTGKELSFVPMYIAPRLRKLCLGKPIRFCADKPMDEERERIRQYLMDEITKIGRSLPEHTVVPYRNIRSKDYPSNRAEEGADYEKTGC